ncbi:hypothetical protein ATJ88_2479 [Isoptericola jiangsuensis]|uniref:PKD domain-containing protein n=1 Tax=Isoptericola jiangsuensis TaxID=548579 RepID=A0A2A9EYZ8_9MICO|nr:hypothetical protein [Isoptericola jiangsuensis]PFG43771.1 hypothetical protein ATJ88_2479 [Isoptericola jiangsuensis]
MRRAVQLLIIAVCAATLVLLGQGGPAPAADPVTCPPGQTPIGGTCYITITDPGSGGGAGGSDGGSDSGDGGTENVSNGPAVCRYGDLDVPCQAEGYVWNASRMCYSKVADPQPPTDDPIWGGRTEGVIIACTPPHCVVAGVGDDDCYNDLYWAAAAPGASGPSPRELADRAVDAMNLRAITIGIVPEPVTGSVGLVGMPTWMWAAEPSESSTGPITRSASAGGTTVTATGRLDRIMWSMGDGSTPIACGAGTPYADSYGRASSPDCGHHYTEQGRYTVTATSSWTVEWSGGGQSGSIPLQFVDSAQITMGEAQVLVQ